MVLARFNCHPGKLAAAVGRFRKKKVLVLGDVMLDRFVWGSVSRISPEAPVPVVEIREETACLGGAANVAANISSLGGEPFPLTIVGNDAEGEQLRAGFRQLGASVSGVLIDKDRATSVKTRIIAHHQQVCRTDREDRSPLAPELQRRIVDWFRTHLDAMDAVVVSDYAKGFITLSLLKKILPLAKSAQKIVCVDPKLRNLAAYRPATVITPNLAEAERAAGINISDEKTLVRSGKKILRQTGIDHLLVTRGEHGMALFEGDSNSKVTQIPTLAREVFDVTGAGDTVISTLCLGLVSGLSILEAAILSNIAAGIVVGKLGTASVTPEELLSGIRQISEL
ncbi:MAG: D-glycero-beta-D-manno-heptose-7-phosphate kinase [Acidobacteriia bacterium]|nr:D-glycero-beta-D-manno-heptose-7-phosphate kinase [Terriglobia bacterium]